MIGTMNDNVKNTAPQNASPEHQNTPKNNKRLRLISTLFMLALIAVTLYVIFRDTTLSEFWSAVQSADPLWLLAALGASLFASLMFGVALHFALLIQGLLQLQGASRDPLLQGGVGLLQLALIGQPLAGG